MNLVDTKVAIMLAFLCLVCGYMGGERHKEITVRFEIAPRTNNVERTK